MKSLSILLACVSAVCSCSTYRGSDYSTSTSVAPSNDVPKVLNDAKKDESDNPPPTEDELSKYKSILFRRCEPLSIRGFANPSMNTGLVSGSGFCRSTVYRSSSDKKLTSEQLINILISAFIDEGWVIDENFTSKHNTRRLIPKKNITIESLCVPTHILVTAYPSDNRGFVSCDYWFEWKYNWGRKGNAIRKEIHSNQRVDLTR